MVTVTDAATSYGEYFAVMQKISRLLSQGVDLLSSGRNQALVKVALGVTLERLAYTADALHHKYAFTHASLTGETMRIATSGFPHHIEIDDMVNDLVLRDKNSAHLVDVHAQKVAWLEQAVRTGNDDADLLWRIGERIYLDRLNDEKMLLPVMTGDIEYRGMTEDGERMYVFWWVCYSTRDHCPCVHVLEFTQDVGDNITPMHEEGPSEVAFRQTIRQRGKRTSTVSVMASDIDHALPYIHPKRLMRLTFEQLYTAHLVAEYVDPGPEKAAAEFYFTEFARPDDFLLIFSHDVVVSKGTKKASKLSFNGADRQEIFDLEVGGPRAYQRGATTSSRIVLVPHDFLQSAQTRAGEPLNLLLADTDMKLAYTKGEKLDAVK